MKKILNQEIENKVKNVLDKNKRYMDADEVSKKIGKIDGIRVSPIWISDIMDKLVVS